MSDLTKQSIRQQAVDRYLTYVEKAEWGQVVPTETILTEAEKIANYVLYGNETPPVKGKFTQIREELANG